MEFEQLLCRVRTAPRRACEATRELPRQVRREALPERSGAAADSVACHAYPAPHVHYSTHDAGCVREQMRAITGHTIAGINEVLDRYTKLTADQAGEALMKRLAHEGRPQESTVSAIVRR